MTERAQSEILGYLLVFTLVLATMSLIAVVGLSELQDVRDDERTTNAERAFEILADNIDDVASGGATSQATEISLADSRLSVGDPVTFTVSGESVTDPSQNFSFAYTARPIVFDVTQGDRVVYAGGATFRDGRSGAAMKDRPALLLTPNRSVVQIVQTRGAGSPSAVGGSSTVRVRTERAQRELVRVNTTTYNLTVEIDSPRAPAWARHLDEQPGVTCGSPTGGSVSCSLTTDRVYVSVVRLDVYLD